MNTILTDIAFALTDHESRQYVKNEAEQTLAQKWLEEQDLEIREDKIVRIK